MGHIYKRGRRFYITYYRNGRPRYVSTHSDKISVARRMLRQIEGDLAYGKTPRVTFDKVLIDELLDALIADQERRGKKSVPRTIQAVKFIKNHFGGRYANSLSTADFEEYARAREEAGISSSTVNRELNILKSAYRLGQRLTPRLVDLVPYFPLRQVDNVRKGFFEHGDYLALLEALPEYLKPVLRFGYASGWRLSEIINLTWDRVDLYQRTAWLNPGETKSGEGRVLFLDDEIYALLTDLHGRRVPDCPYVFRQERGGGRIGQYYKSWRKACQKAGIPGKLFHDLRRTAVRNLIQAGIPERVAMEQTGHKTRSIFDRYHIVSPGDLREASKKYHEYRQKQSPERKVVPLRAVASKKSE